MTERSLDTLVARGRIIQNVCRERLTPTQYRRVSLLYGFHRDPMTFRQVAAIEGVSAPSVHESHVGALRRLEKDAILIFMWLTIWL